MLARAPGGPEPWGERLRTLPIFVEEDVISNTMYTDGLSLDNDSLTSRHSGKGYMAFIDGSVELIEPYLDVPEQENLSLTDPIRPNGWEMSGLAVRRGTSGEYVSQTYGDPLSNLNDGDVTNGLAEAYGWINDPRRRE